MSAQTDTYQCTDRHAPAHRQAHKSHRQVNTSAQQYVHRNAFLQNRIPSNFLNAKLSSREFGIYRRKPLLLTIRTDLTVLILNWRHNVLLSVSLYSLIRCATISNPHERMLSQLLNFYVLLH